MVTITDKQLIFIYDEGQRLFEQGDPLDSCYYQITLSNDFMFNVSASWSKEEITAEVEASLARAQLREDNAEAEAQDALDILDTF